MVIAEIHRIYFWLYGYTECTTFSGVLWPVDLPETVVVRTVLKFFWCQVDDSKCHRDGHCTVSQHLQTLWRRTCRVLCRLSIVIWTWLQAYCVWLDFRLTLCDLTSSLTIFALQHIGHKTEVRMTFLTSSERAKCSVMKRGVSRCSIIQEGMSRCSIMEEGMSRCSVMQEGMSRCSIMERGMSRCSTRGATAAHHDVGLWPVVCIPVCWRKPLASKMPLPRGLISRVIYLQSHGLALVSVHVDWQWQQLPEPFLTNP